MNLQSTINHLISNNSVTELQDLMRKNDLVIKNGIVEHRYNSAYWDKRQLVKKINLNS